MFRTDEFLEWITQPPPKRTMFQKIKDCVIGFFAIVLYLISNPKEWKFYS